MTRGLKALLGSLGLAMALALAPTGAQAQTKEGEEAKAPEATTPDTLIFRNGNMLTGTILSETETTIKFKSAVGGMSFETEYKKDELLSIRRGVKAAETTTPAPAPAAPKPELVGESPAEVADATKERIYWMDWRGKFGEDITETPVRAGIKDALKNKCTTIIVFLDADFSRDDPIQKEEKFSEEGSFDAFHRTESVMAMIEDEFTTTWTTRPRLVFWVRRAMEGAAFIPFMSKEVYFTEDGRMGGIGNLSHMMKGHERVVQKQISLRMARFIGWAAEGGYPESICKAMALEEFVLSVKMVDGKPVLLERTPQSPDEELLTDDAKGANADRMEDVARGRGNDVLTLDARIAKLVGVSKGTVDTREALLAALGLERIGQVVPGRSSGIFKDWTRGLTAGKAQMDKLFDEFRRIRVEGTYNDRSRARGTQLHKLDELIAILERYKEALDWHWLGPHLGFGSVDQAQTQFRSIQEQIRVQQRADRR